MRSNDDIEGRVRECYSTWSSDYFDDYYGTNAPYPPVHLDLVKKLLEETRARRILDAGCGPASMLRELPENLDLFGFDLTPEMVEEARAVFRSKGLEEGRVWEGSVTDADAYFSSESGSDPYEAVLCVGVMPHIPAELESKVLDNVFSSLAPGGTAIIEARNELFSLFTLNRYSHSFFLERLIPVERLREAAAGDPAMDEALAELEGMFRTDLPPIRKGKVGEPGYDEVLSRAHNPLVLKMDLERAGFRNVRTLFFHFHSLPPFLGSRVPGVFRNTSLEMEDPEDWRGHFMASAFLLVAQRP